jgi:hypothetical protein
MRVNRGGKGDGGGSSDQGDRPGGMSAPSGRSSETQGSRTSGGMQAPSGGGTKREGADALRSRTDRGNQNDEDIGSSASRGGGGGETNAPRRAAAADLDPTPDVADRFGAGGGSSGNPDVTGTKDAAEE